MEGARDGARAAPPLTRASPGGDRETATKESRAGRRRAGRGPRSESPARPRGSRRAKAPRGTEARRRPAARRRRGPRSRRTAAGGRQDSIRRREARGRERDRRWAQVRGDRDTSAAPRTPCSARTRRTARTHTLRRTPPARGPREGAAARPRRFAKRGGEGGGRRGSPLPLGRPAGPRCSRGRAGRVRASQTRAGGARRAPPNPELVLPDASGRFGPSGGFIAKGVGRSEGGMGAGSCRREEGHGGDSCGRPIPLPASIPFPDAAGRRRIRPREAARAEGEAVLERLRREPWETTGTALSRISTSW